MLPGFRFLFAAILLSTSILVFGLGAAALLRATHEQAVANPSWRTGPQEQAFAQAPVPVLAVLRVEPVTPDPTPVLRDQVPTIGLPASGPEQQAALTSTPVPPAEPQAAPAAAVAETPTAEPAPSDAPAASPAAPPAVVEDRPPLAAASEPRPVATAAAPAPVKSDTTAARMSALAEATAPTLKPDGAPESKATKRRAHRAKKRHRIVRRPAPVQPQTFDLFTTQQQPAYAATATRAR